MLCRRLCKCCKPCTIWYQAYVEMFLCKDPFCFDHDISNFHHCQQNWHHHGPFCPFTVFQKCSGIPPCLGKTTIFWFCPKAPSKADITVIIKWNNFTLWHCSKNNELIDWLILIYESFSSYTSLSFVGWLVVMLMELLKSQIKPWNDMAAWEDAVAICHNHHSWKIS